MSAGQSLTQRLRNLIEEARSGSAGFEEIHNELSDIEVAAQLPLTDPDPWFNMTPGQIAEYKAQERIAA